MQGKNKIETIETKEKPKRIQITTVEQLKSESNKQANFFIILGESGSGYFRSTKTIRWYKKVKCFCVHNHIDGTEQLLNEKEIMNDDLTNIGKAIRKGAFFKDV